MATSVTSAPTEVTVSSANIADPGPLGLAAFALTTFLLSAGNAGIVKAAVGAVLGLMLAYGGIVQVLAGMWEYKKGNTFGATAFASYGAFWVSLWFLETWGVPRLVADKAPNIPHAVGGFLLGWTIFTLYMWIASFKTNGALIAVFTVLLFAFIFLFLGAWQSNTSLTKVGGWLGIITAFLAWYTSAAGVINSTFKRVVLPVMPR